MNGNIRKEIFFRKADRIIKEIEDELKIDEKKRSSNITTKDLENMLKKIKEMKTSIGKRSASKNNKKYSSLRRLIIDQWPLGTTLGKEISELEDLYKNL